MANTRNNLAGKSTGKSESAQFFRDNPKSREAKNAYNKKYHSSTKRKKYRAALNKANRKAKTYGNGDGIDKSHTKKGTLVNESASTNRKRNGKGNNKRLK